jgi:hypothetical protein
VLFGAGRLDQSAASRPPDGTTPAASTISCEFPKEFAHFGLGSRRLHVGEVTRSEGSGTNALRPDSSPPNVPPTGSSRTDDAEAIGDFRGMHSNLIDCSWFGEDSAAGLRSHCGHDIHCDEPRQGIHSYRPGRGHRGDGNLCGRRRRRARRPGHGHAADDGRSRARYGPRATVSRCGLPVPRLPSASSSPRSRHF